MVERSKIEDMLTSLSEYVRTLSELRALPRERIVQEVPLQWAVQHGLQCSIQCLLDIGLHILVDQDLSSPKDQSGILRDLGRHGIVPDTFAQKAAGMVRFRNLLVHRYFLVNASLVADHLQQDLADFVAFAVHVRNWLDRATPLPEA